MRQIPPCARQGFCSAYVVRVGAEVSLAAIRAMKRKGGMWIARGAATFQANSCFGGWVR